MWGWLGSSKSDSVSVESESIILRGLFLAKKVRGELGGEDMEDWETESSSLKRFLARLLRASAASELSVELS